MSRKPVSLLFVEDVPFYYDSLCDALAVQEDFRQVEILPAFCLEQALYQLKKSTIAGVIIDLHILHCDTSTLAEYGEEPLNLREYTPARFFGIGLLLYLQHLYTHVAKMPKLILSESSFDSYSHYYNRLQGPREHANKAEEEDANNAIIFQWIQKNFGNERRHFKPTALQ